MGWDAPWHWVILAVVVIALFGYKRLPEASRSLGKSLRIFKTEIKGMAGDDAAREAEKTGQLAPPVTDAAGAASAQPVDAPTAPPAPPVAAPTATPVQTPNGTAAGQPTTPGTV